MKTVFVREPSRVDLAEASVPRPGPGEILVKMKACGICGSDVEKVFGHYGKKSMRLGHEPAGIVTSIGENVSGFAEGDRVFTHHHVPCYSCHLCMHGNETSCNMYSQTNLLPCGLSEQYIVPAWNVSNGGVLKLPDLMTFEDAAMIEPLGCCVRAWKKLHYRRDDTVAVLGVGPTGIMHAMLAHARGFANILCMDVNDFRLDFAKKTGATHTIRSDDPSRIQQAQDIAPTGIDIAIVATGNLGALADAIDMVRHGGQIMMFGVPSKGDTINIDMSKVYSKEISLHTSYAASDKDTKEAMELIASGQISMKTLVTHKYTISQSQDAFEHARTGLNAMKIIIED